MINHFKSKSSKLGMVAILLLVIILTNWSCLQPDIGELPRCSSKTKDARLKIQPFNTWAKCPGKG